MTINNEVGDASRIIVSFTQSWNEIIKNPSIMLPTRNVNVLSIVLSADTQTRKESGG
jgi:hypothetical protein